jgi:transposase-like protein
MTRKSDRKSVSLKVYDDNRNMRKNYSSEFKAKAVNEVLREAKSKGEISSEKGVHVKQLNRRKKQQ